MIISSPFFNTICGIFVVFKNSLCMICPTYPPAIVVPQPFTDQDLLSVASYRSKGRIPALVYMDHETGASMSRSSQPLGDFLKFDFDF